MHGRPAVLPGAPRRVAGSRADLAIVAACELVVAGAGLVFLRTDDTASLVGFLAAAAAIMAALRRLPLGERLRAAFAGARREAIALAFVLAVLLPFLVGANSYILHILIISELYIVLALALNFQLGSANIVNFATAASYGIGAYTSALLAVHFGLSFWVTILAGAGMATLFGFLLGLPCMRTRDSYLALVTIAFGIVIHQLINNMSWTGGPNGVVAIPPPVLFGHSFRQPIEILGLTLPRQANFYYLALALVGLAVLTASRLHASRVGLAWNALRADEIAARCAGIDVVKYKILAFCTDAFLSAFAGTIYAHYVGYIAPDNFGFLVSVTVVTMVIVGGMDSIAGVILGAILLTVLPEKFRAFQDYRLLLYGVIVIAMLLFRPQGLLPRRLRRYS